MRIHTGTVTTSPKGFSISFEDISPERAKEFLTANHNNVPLSKRKVEQYASDLREGRWHENSSCIAFSKDGELLDGQTRLQAIIESGVTLNGYMVMSGFDRSAMPSIDPYKPAWNFIKREGGAYPKISASAAKLVINYEAGRNLLSVVSKPAISSYVIGDPHIQDISGVAQQAKKVIPVGPLAAVLYLGTKHGANRERVHSFVAGLTDDPLDFHDGTPSHALRIWLDRKREERRRIQSSDVDLFNAIARAWNAHVSGEAIKFFHARFDANGIEIKGARRAGGASSPGLSLAA